MRRGARVQIIKPEGQRFQLFPGATGTIRRRGHGVDPDGQFGEGWFLIEVNGGLIWYHRDELRDVD